MNVDQTVRQLLLQAPSDFQNYTRTMQSILFSSTPAFRWRKGDICLCMELFNGDEYDNEPTALNLTVQEEYERVSFGFNAAEKISWDILQANPNLFYSDQALVEQASLALMPMTPHQHDEFCKQAQSNVVFNIAAVNDMDSLMACKPHPVLAYNLVKSSRTPLKKIPDNANLDWLEAIEEFCNWILTADYSTVFDAVDMGQGVATNADGKLRGRKSVIAPTDKESQAYLAWKQHHGDILANLDFAQATIKRIKEVRTTGTPFALNK